MDSRWTHVGSEGQEIVQGAKAQIPFLTLLWSELGHTLRRRYHALQEYLSYINLWHSGIKLLEGTLPSLPSLSPYPNSHFRFLVPFRGHYLSFELDSS